jgi:hypothetical protein
MAEKEKREIDALRAYRKALKAAINLELLSDQRRLVMATVDTEAAPVKSISELSAKIDSFLAKIVVVVVLDEDDDNYYAPSAVEALTSSGLKATFKNDGVNSSSLKVLMGLHSSNYYRDVTKIGGDYNVHVYDVDLGVTLTDTATDKIFGKINLKAKGSDKSKGGALKDSIDNMNDKIKQELGSQVLDYL